MVTRMHIKSGSVGDTCSIEEGFAFFGAAFPTAAYADPAFTEGAVSGIIELMPPRSTL